MRGTKSQALRSKKISRRPGKRAGLNDAKNATMSRTRCSIGAVTHPAGRKEASGRPQVSPSLLRLNMGGQKYGFCLNFT